MKFFDITVVILLVAIIIGNIQGCTRPASSEMEEEVAAIELNRRDKRIRSTRFTRTVITKMDDWNQTKVYVLHDNVTGKDIAIVTSNDGPAIAVIGESENKPQEFVLPDGKRMLPEGTCAVCKGDGVVDIGRDYMKACIYCAKPKSKPKTEEKKKEVAK